MKKTILIFMAVCVVALAQAQTYYIKTIAGNGGYGFGGDGGAATSAQLGDIRSIATDNIGNIYTCNLSNQVIRKIDTNGIISTIAGNGTSGFSGDGGPATNAQLSNPHGVTTDQLGNVYFSDWGNKVIRKINTSGIISTIAGTPGVAGNAGDGGPATAATINDVKAITADSAGNVYIASGGRLRVINTAGTISLVTAGMYASLSMTMDRFGNIYSFDHVYNVVRKITLGGSVTTVVGTGGFGSLGNGGPATAAQLAYLGGVAIDMQGNLYTSETASCVVRNTNSTGIINAFVGHTLFTGSFHYYCGFTGDNGPALTAEISFPTCMATDHKGNIYVLDGGNVRIRKMYFFNYAPEFTNGDTASLSICKNSGAYDINSLLSVSDQDSTNVDTVTWSVVTAPAHGTLVASYTTMTTGSVLTPTAMTYAPATGYVGSDIFVVRVFDGAEADTITINVTVNPLPLSITGAPKVCLGSTTTLYNATTGGTWISGNTSVASVDAASGVVSGLLVGTAIISYVNGSGCPRTVVFSVNPLPGTISGSPTTCVGQNTTLTNTVSGGAWSSSNTAVANIYTPSGIYVGISAGTANITYTLPGGCATSVAVTVNGAPAAITVSGPVCIGANTTLSHPESGGTWTSSNLAIATIDTFTGVVTGVGAGYVTITYRLSAGCFKTINLTYNFLPSISGTTTAVCEGATTALTASPSGGMWASTDGAIATISGSGVVTGIGAGTTTISYQSLAGCFRTRVVSVNPSSSPITGSLFVCNGSTTSLSSSPSGGTWATTYTTVATVDASGTVSGVAAGTTAITYTMSPGCRKTAVVTVGVMPAVITGTTDLCAGSTTALASATGSCTWSSSDTSVATVSTTGIVTGLSSGTATISYTHASSCARATTVTVNAGVSANTGTPSVCVGATTALSNATSGGTWSSSATGKATVNATTGVVTGVSAGTANISYTVSGGCRSITQVTVNAAVAAITGATGVCIGATTTFTNATGGGTWSSSNPSLGSVEASTGIITGIASGALTITYTLPTGCFKTKALTVNALPGAITGSTSVCPGATTTLSGTSGYSWTSSNTGVATIGVTSGVVTGVSAGTVAITFQSTAGCIRVTTVTVLPLPTAISGTLSVCAGATTALSSVGTTGGTWASSAITKATVGSTTGIVSGVSGGTSRITYTWTNSCKVTAVATVNPLPAAGAIVGAGTMSVTSTPTQTLTASSPGGTWASSNAAVATIDGGSGFMSAVSVGTVRITYTVTNGCGSAFVTRLFSVVAGRPGSPTAGTINEVMVSVYPNPTSGNITIETPVAGSFTVYTIDGREVSNYKMTEASTSIAMPANLTAGVYMCRFSGDDGSIAMARIVYQP